jgi:hypothetical protein
MYSHSYAMRHHHYDPALVQNLMRHAVGRGIAPVPASGVGLTSGAHREGLKYHLREELPHGGDKGKGFGSSLMEELKKRVTDI